MRKTVDKIKGILKKYPDVFQTNEAYHLSTLNRAPDMASIVWEVQKAFEQGFEPEKAKDSSSEAFFLKDREGTKIAIFKPIKYADGEMRRELAAYRLDHEGFAGVPPTVITCLTHPFFKGRRRGSCQLFIEDAVAVVHFNRRVYPEFSSAQIRRIASLDIRLLNNDRHTSNLVYKDNRLFPIDHAISLPQKTHGTSFVWLHWEQSMTPFTEGEKKYILNLDLEKDHRMLIEEVGIDSESADLHYLASLLLKKGVGRDLTAYQIGSCMKRQEIFKEDGKKHWDASSFHYSAKIVAKTRKCGWDSYVAASLDEIERLLENETNKCKHQSTAR